MIVKELIKALLKGKKLSIYDSEYIQLTTPKDGLYKGIEGIYVFYKSDYHLAQEYMILLNLHPEKFIIHN